VPDGGHRCNVPGWNRYLAEKLLLSETVEINPDTGNFRAVPIPLKICL
jgi:hypothetical protein